MLSAPPPAGPRALRRMHADAALNSVTAGTHHGHCGSRVSCITAAAIMAGTPMRTTAPSPPRELPGPLQRRLEARVLTLMQPAAGAPLDFSRPPGEAALCAPDSVSWRVFRNPLSMFIGGVAAVVLELAEPRVRTGVWEHTSFRERPMDRLRRTAQAAMLSVYGPRGQAEAQIARVTRLHERVQGVTPEGQPYHALDPALLDWVQATASFGFLEAYAAHVRPLSQAERDRYYAEGLPAARLYGATGAPQSQAQQQRLFEAMQPALRASPIVDEFLHIMRRIPALPPPLRPAQSLLVRAAVQLVPAAVRERLALGARWQLAPWETRRVAQAARAVDRWLFRAGPAVQSCRRLGLPDDYLYGGA